MISDYYTDSEGWPELRQSIVEKECNKKGLDLTLHLMSW